MNENWPIGWTQWLTHRARMRYRTSRRGAARPMRIRLEQLECRANPATFFGGVSVAVADLNGDGVNDIITGAGPGGGPHVEVFDGATGQVALSFMAYDPSFTGGVWVAAGDLNGDGKTEIVTGAGPGGTSDVRVFDNTGNLLREFNAYDPKFRGGVRVAVGDVNGDGKADIVTAPGIGGTPDVRIFDSATQSLSSEFMAYDPRFNGGVFVAVGDATGDGKADIVTGPGAGGGADVRIFDPATQTMTSELLAYDPAFRGGVHVAVGTGADGKPVIITGAGSGGGPHVRVFDTAGNEVTGLFAYDPNFRGGAFVAAGALNAAAGSDIVTGAGGGGGGPDVRAFDGSTAAQLTEFSAYAPFAPPAGGFATSTRPPPPPPSNSPPDVSKPIADVSVAQNASPTVLDLSQNFTDPDVGQSVVRLSTSAGPIDVDLFDQKTPQTVNNFLNYVTSGAYTNSIFHRSMPNFVLQGGGFAFQSNPSNVVAIPANAPVLNEPGISNTRGTIAMAKLGNDPNSATNQFFFNLGDNSSNLDNQNGGFTVFGQATATSLPVIDALAAVPTQDRSSFNSAFTNLPLQNFPQPPAGHFPTDTTAANYDLINSATVISRSDQLSFSIVSNTNPALVTPSVAGNKLTLTYTAGQTGTATIVIRATDRSGAQAVTSFQVTVS